MRNQNGPFMLIEIVGLLVPMSAEVLDVLLKTLYRSERIPAPVIGPSAAAAAVPGQHTIHRKAFPNQIGQRRGAQQVNCSIRIAIPQCVHNRQGLNEISETRQLDDQRART